MCLENVTQRIAKIATEDIPCYKLVGKSSFSRELLTPYQKVPVKLGSTYKSKLIRHSNGNVTYGLHAFLTLDQALCNTFTSLYDVRIVKCIIPKGSKYYIGEFYSHYKKTAIAADTLIYGKRFISKKLCVQ